MTFEFYKGRSLSHKNIMRPLFHISIRGNTRTNLIFILSDKNKLPFFKWNVKNKYKKIDSEKTKVGIVQDSTSTLKIQK